jgi:cephalosporin-C deacetylase-like acetyl esterase
VVRLNQIRPSLVIFFLSLILSSAFLHAQKQLVFTPFHATVIYQLGETAGWTVKPASNATCQHFTYTIKKNNKDMIKSGDLDLSSASATIETKLDEPAMLMAIVTAACPAAADNSDAKVDVSKKDPQHEATLGAAIAPQLLKPSVPKPADFDSFWKSKLKLLRKVPINPALTPVPQENSAVNLYTVKLDSVDSHLQGYLATPAKVGKFPALIMYQYAGVYKLNPAGAIKHAEEGWLTLNADSHDIPPTESTGVPTDYSKIGNRDRNTSYFLNMYLRDTRAVQYIATRPDWDHKTIVLVGTSMGGQQSLVTAGLNPKRITAVIVNEPSGADTNGNLHGRQAGYPNWPSDYPQVMQTSLYFDPVNFAPHIKAQTIIAVGFIDTTSPPAGLWTVLNQIPAPKEMVSMIESDHNNRTPEKQSAFNKRSVEAMEELLHAAPLGLSASPGAAQH